MMDKPYQFGRWTSPWCLGLCEGHDFYELVWLRGYKETSHCGTNGCCEQNTIKYGPVLFTSAYSTEEDDEFTEAIKDALLSPAPQWMIDFWEENPGVVAYFLKLPDDD